MRLFDRLITADGVAKVVDLGHLAFQRFFAMMDEIEFAEEAQRRALEIIVLFAADPHPTSVKAYANLQRRLPSLIMVPVFNDGILKGRKLRDQYPFTRAATVPLQIPLLPPALKAHAERSGQSFVDFHSQLPTAVPIGPVFELRSWTKRAFLEFRGAGTAAVDGEAAGVAEGVSAHTYPSTDTAPCPPRHATSVMARGGHASPACARLRFAHPTDQRGLNAPRTPPACAPARRACAACRRRPAPAGR